MKYCINCEHYCPVEQSHVCSASSYSCYQLNHDGQCQLYVKKGDPTCMSCEHRAGKKCSHESRASTCVDYVTGKDRVEYASIKRGGVCEHYRSDK